MNFFSSYRAEKRGVFAHTHECSIALKSLEKTASYLYL